MARKRPRFHDWAELPVAEVREAIQTIGGNIDNPDVWEEVADALYQYWAALMTNADGASKQTRLEIRRWFRHIAKQADCLATELEAPSKQIDRDNKLGFNREYIRQAIAPAVLGEFHALDNMAAELRRFASKARQVDALDHPALEGRPGPQGGDEMAHFAKRLGTIFENITGSRPTSTYNEATNTAAPAVEFLHRMLSCVAKDKPPLATLARQAREAWPDQKSESKS